jgi:hypothetical protein
LHIPEFESEIPIENRGRRLVADAVNPAEGCQISAWTMLRALELMVISITGKTEGKQFGRVATYIEAYLPQDFIWNAVHYFQCGYSSLKRREKERNRDDLCWIIGGMR